MILGSTLSEIECELQAESTETLLLPSRTELRGSAASSSIELLKCYEDDYEPSTEVSSVNALGKRPRSHSFSMDQVPLSHRVCQSSVTSPISNPSPEPMKIEVIFCLNFINLPHFLRFSNF